MSQQYKSLLSSMGVHIPEIFMPNTQDMSKWAVVACDQYTSEPHYWESVSNYVNGSASTLPIIFPEVYLENDNADDRINEINNEMQKYLNEGIINSINECFVLVDRKTNHTDSRKGLVVALDLDCYDYTKGCNALIRATEGTVIERLPPRIKIRQNAAIELPHIMVLIDDPKKMVIEPLFDKLNQFEKLYDFDLMMNSGHIKGYKVCDEDSFRQIAASLNALCDKKEFSNKYCISEHSSLLLFAVGDGNHSLASAKGHWENVKIGLGEDQKLCHPARYALVELVNVHDAGLVFEPIHRVLFNVNADDLIHEFKSYYENINANSCHGECAVTQAPYISNIRCANTITDHTFRYITSNGEASVTIDNPVNNLHVSTLQVFLDTYIKQHPEVKIDYIHGEDVVTKLGALPGNIGFYLPAMDKMDLFKTVILDGALPRKTFSMGEADEKRFYLECRKIK